MELATTVHVQYAGTGFRKGLFSFCVATLGFPTRLEEEGEAYSVGCHLQSRCWMAINPAHWTFNAFLNL